MLENVTLRLEGVTPRLSPSHARISPSHVSTSSPMQWGLPYTRRRRVGLRLVRCFMPSVAAETNGFCRPSYQSTRIWCSHNSNSELSNSRAGSVLSNSEDDCAQVGNQRRDRKREKLVYEIELDEIEIARLKSLFFIQSAVLILMGIVVIIWGGTTVYGLWMIFCTNKIGKSAGNNLLKSFLSESFLSQFSSALKFVHNTMLVGYVAGLVKQISSSYDLKKAKKKLEFKKLGLTDYDEKEVIKKLKKLETHYGEEKAKEAMKKL